MLLFLILERSDICPIRRLRTTKRRTRRLLTTKKSITGGSEQLLMVKMPSDSWAKFKDRSLYLPLCLHTLAEHNGTGFTPWATLPGDYSSDVPHSFRPGLDMRIVENPLVVEWFNPHCLNHPPTVPNEVLLGKKLR
ncbi:hypothetical protein TNCV_2861531 [Trichonephila clavipes]|nr:hypothetical protein TNCV_2861531 [Trichonephila clavipes]